VAVPGASVHLHGASLTILSTTPASLAGLDVLHVIFDAPAANFAGAVPSANVLLAPSYLEVAGEDRGLGAAGFVDNAVIDTLQIGGDGTALLRLLDGYDNDLASNHPEALYVRHLILNAGSELDLGGLHVYTLEFVNTGGTLTTNGGQLSVVPEPCPLGAITALGVLLTRRPRRRSPL
jgi:hypothetical protein